MEAAIAWLAQTILAALQIDKLDAWIRQVGLADDIDKLKSQIRIVKMVVSTTKERGIGNEPLSEPLGLLEDHLYEAEDVVDELDYYRLQQQIEGADDPEGVHAMDLVDDTSAGNTDVQSSRGGKKRWSKAWNSFDVVEEENGEPIKARCKYCPTEVKCVTRGGTSGMRNHSKICKKKPGSNHQLPNPSGAAGAAANARTIVIGDSPTRKRRRGNEEQSQTITPNARTTWDKAELSNRIQKLTNQIQDIRGEVSECLKLYGSDSASSSNHHRHTTAQQHLRTSSFVPRKVWGRDAEKNSILKLVMAADRSDSVTILPIVGIAGIGKTTLAQLIYNDPFVQTIFCHKIWVWVSHNFDEVRLTRDILDSISQEIHEEINCFAKLQEKLKGHANSKRFLLILDDVWDNMNNFLWDKVLAPLVSSHVKGNVILVTTRNLSVAQRVGTLKPVNLGALEHGDFWLLFKSRAFGENYEEHQSLSIVGLEIAEKLKGNPLAAESTGELLSKKLDIDYWRNILKNEDWKSMQLSRGIMHALKLSYDQLPYHLQQCFSYCSIFPDSYEFLGDELVGFWIAQRFVKCSNSSQSLEGIGRCYLIDLVNLGFLQEVKREESYLDSQILYAVCGIMHDFMMMVSRDDSASIDGLQCKKMPQILRHLSIVTGSAYNKDQHGNNHRNEKFEENLRNTVTSVSKLRTLVLLGNYDSFFLLLFQDIFQKAHNLRVLQMSSRATDFLQRGYDEVDGAFPQVLSKLYHLQVLDVGSYTDPSIPGGINYLGSLQHLVLHKGLYSSIATIGNVTSFQDLHDFKFQISSGFEITPLQSMDELVQHWVNQLGNVKTLKEVYEAGLRKNELLEKLHLSWKEFYAEIGLEILPSSEPFMDEARDVLEGLERSWDLKILQISGSNDATSSNGFPSNVSVTSLQKLHLYGCGEWQTLPYLERFPLLTALTLSNLQKVTKVLVPSLEELVLVEMPKLEICSCASMEGMKSRLRVLQIEDCQALKAFDLFEKDDNLESTQRSWLPGLKKLILRDCPLLKVVNPLPPSTTCSELLIIGAIKLPSLKGSCEKLLIGVFDNNNNSNDDDDDDDGDDDDVHDDGHDDDDWYGYNKKTFDKNSDELGILDDKYLAFHNLRNLKLMIIDGCQNLMSISLGGFSQLFSLKTLKIWRCKKIFSSDVMPEHTLEDVTAANCMAFPCLEYLSIRSCGVAGKWLSLLLRHAPGLQELHLADEIKVDALTGLAQDGLVHIPLNLMSSLTKIAIKWCPRLTFNWSEEGLSGFTSLQELTILKQITSLLHKCENDDRANRRWLLPTSLENLYIAEWSEETLQPCFPRNLTSLKKLRVQSVQGLESLQLHSCTALEELKISYCKSLTALEGMQSLVSLRHLRVDHCPCLPPYLESFSRQVYELLPRLETLHITDPAVLTTSFFNHLTSLRRLTLQLLVLTEEQERALVLLKSLQELEFSICFDLVDLPAGLQLLPSLKRLKIFLCKNISKLPETGLPLSLEKLEIERCSKKLANLCRGKATNKLRVKIN